MLNLTDSHIDAILAAAKADGMSDIDVALRMQERRRKLLHAEAKANQPELGLRASALHADLVSMLRSMWDSPLSDAEKSAAQGDIEFLVLTIQDCADSGDAEDFIFACLRLSRKLLARNHHLWRKQDIPVNDQKASG